MTAKDGPGDAWSRPAVTFRLSSRRKRDLELLASGTHGPLTPTSALDHAIELALAARAAANVHELSDSADTEDRLGQLSALIETHAREQRTALSELARQLKDLRDVMMAAAQSGVADFEDEPVGAREWLQAETQPLPDRSLLATAKWQAKSRLDDDSFAIDVLVERVATPSLSGQAARGLPALVRFAPIASDSAAARLDSMRSAYLMCQPGPSGWTVSIHPIDADGAPGSSIGMLTV